MSLKLSAKSAIFFLVSALVIVSAQTAFAWAPHPVLFGPERIALDNDGNIYALINGNDSVTYGVHVYAPDGKESVIGQGYFLDIATDGNNSLYMLSESRESDRCNITVSKREPNGAISIVFHNDSSIYGPRYVVGSIAADPSGNLYVFDYYTTWNYTGDRLGRWFGGSPIQGSGRIAKLCPNGTLITIRTADGLYLPEETRIAVDANGTIYTQHYNVYPDGRVYIRIFPVPSEHETFAVNNVIVGRDDRVYLAEGDSFNVSVINGIVARLSTVGPGTWWYGCGPDLFGNVSAIAADKNGRVYVADPYNQRIVWFDGNNYTYGTDYARNVAGKGVLWDNVVAGDNATVWQQKLNEELLNKPGIPSPGFEYLWTFAGLAITGMALLRIKRRL